MYTRNAVFDAFLSLIRWCNVPISRGLADLRASLAGRARGGGRCYRLCTAAAFVGAAGPAGGSVAEDFCRGTPTSALEDLAPMLLLLKALGMQSLQRLPLLQPPPAPAVAAAAERLLQQQAIDEAGNITKPLGLLMSQGVLSPELTRLLVLAADEVRISTSHMSSPRRPNGTHTGGEAGKAPASPAYQQHHLCLMLSLQAFGCSLEASAICALLSGPPVWRRSALQAAAPFHGVSSKGTKGSPTVRQRLSLCRALLGAIEGDPLTSLNVLIQYLDVRNAEGEAAAARWAERYLVEEEVVWRAAKKQQMLLNWMDRANLPRVRSSTQDAYAAVW